LPTRQNIFI